MDITKPGVQKPHCEPVGVRCQSQVGVQIRLRAAENVLTVRADQLFLYRMQTRTRAADTLDRHDVRANDAVERREARVDALVDWYDLLGVPFA